jgi:tRNA(fMet)-specific endonuclease VapC
LALRLALDTNRYTDLARGDAALRDLLERAEAVFLPFVVLAELRAGFQGGRRAQQNERGLVRFLQQPGVEVLWPGETTTRIWANLFLQLRRAGTPIPMNDLWIAAQVVEHDLALATRDAHFRQLPQLPLI